jgi:hypothetical protein
VGRVFETHTPNGSRPWSDDELALLGTMLDEAVAERIGRTRDAVRQAREKRNIAPPEENWCQFMLSCSMDVKA